MTMFEETPEEFGGARQRERPGQRTHLSASGLRARGWTPAMVRQLLGEPDLLLAHPQFRSAPQTRLYRVERVAAAERGEAFRVAAAAAVRRSATARASALRRRRKVLDLRRRVYAAIAGAYPDLARERVPQLRAPTGPGNSDAPADSGTHDRQIDRRTPRTGPQEPA
nr:hypothetical protein [Streptomyces chartreusis]